MGARTRGSHRRETDRQLLELVEQEGQTAFGAGVALEANPYPDGGGMAYSGRWARWRQGWRRGEWQTRRADYEASRPGGTR
jgi:hypothetical protein